MLKASEVIKHIEKMYDIKLMDFQKEFVKHVIKGDIIYTPRCFGRSMIYNGYADYLKNVVGKNVDYSVDPDDFDKIFTYKDVPVNTLICNDRLVDWKNENKEKFGKEYECEFTPYDENAELKKQLELEKAKSSFWKLKANGENPIILGSKESMKYITS